MWLRNLQVFRLLDGWTYDSDTLNDKLERHPLLPCGPTMRRSVGWLPVPGADGPYVLSTNGQQMILLGVEQKVLPAAVVQAHAGGLALEIEQAQGYKPGRKQMREIRDAVELDMLARAFTMTRTTRVWIDRASRWLGVEASSAAQADVVIEALKPALGELPLACWKTAKTPGDAMTAWLAGGAAPHGFSIDRDSELRSVADGHPQVRFAHHPLDSALVREHIATGKTVTRLGLTWNDRVSFVLTDRGEIKRLTYLDALKEEAESEADVDYAKASFLICANALYGLLSDLDAALGGVAE